MAAHPQCSYFQLSIGNEKFPEKRQRVIGPLATTKQHSNSSLRNSKKKMKIKKKKKIFKNSMQTPNSKNDELWCPTSKKKNKKTFLTSNPKPSK